METILSRIAVLTAALALLLVSGCCLTSYPVYRSRPHAPHTDTPAAGSVDTPAGPETPRSLDEKKMMAAIEELFGVPYKYGGASKAGMDCSGFVMTVYKQVLGITLPHNARRMTGCGTRVSQRKLRFGDLVFFGKSVSSIDHVGIYIGDGRFAHASTSKGVTIAGLGEKYFRRRYRAAVRIIE